MAKVMFSIMQFFISCQLNRRMSIMEIIIENKTRMDNITTGENEKYYESMYKDNKFSL